MRSLPTITRNLLLLNLIAWLISAIHPFGLDLDNLLGLHYWTANSFHFWQPLTYMFMHADFNHIFFNMFAVLMFAPVLEREWGEKRFLIYYLICGLGAALAQELVWMGMFGAELAVYPHLADQLLTIGASGAVFGILLAFGWLFPDVRMFILFIPIPIRARVLVIIYAVIELFAGLGSMIGFSADHVAHFAHLGGMVFGALVLLYWRYGEHKVKAFRSRLRGHDDDRDNDRWSDYHYQRSI